MVLATLFELALAAIVITCVLKEDALVAFEQRLFKKLRGDIDE